MALIRDAFPDPRQRTHALGTWAVGGAVAGAVFGAFIAHPAAFISGMQLSFTIAAAALVVAALISFGIRTTRHDQEGE